MHVDQWAIVVSVFVTAVLALAPWVFSVHAKLAVLAATIANLEAKVDRLINDHELRVPMCAAHAARLDAFEKKLSSIDEQLKRLTNGPHRRE